MVVFTICPIYIYLFLINQKYTAIEQGHQNVGDMQPRFYAADQNSLTHSMPPFMSYKNSLQQLTFGLLYWKCSSGQCDKNVMDTEVINALIISFYWTAEGP